MKPKLDLVYHLKNDWIYVVLLAFAIAGLTGCQGNKESDESVPENTIVAHTDQAREVNLSEIAESIRYVRLETDIENYAGYFSKIVVFENLIFGSSYNDYSGYFIGIYGINGEKLAVIRGQGKGPGEYIGIDDFLINPYTRQIEILDGRIGKKILRYDLNGVFIDQVQIPDHSEFFALNDSASYYIHNSIFFGRDENPHVLWRIDRNEPSVISQLIPANPVYDNFHSCNFLRRENELGVQTGLRDSIIFINTDGMISSRWKIDFGPRQDDFFKAFRNVQKNSKEELNLLNNFEGRCNIGHLVSSDELLWFYFYSMQVDAPHIHSGLIYSWKTQESITVSELVNDIDQIPLGPWPHSSTPNGEMVFQISPSSLLEMDIEKQSMAFQQSYRKILPHPESDAPVLAFMSMKEL